MREVGYSPNTSKNPKMLTGSKGFRELMAQELPNGLLLRKHRALLEKTERMVVSDGKEGSHVEVTDQPHSDVAKALDMAYKLNGSYKPTEMAHTFKPFEVTEEQREILDNL